MQIGAQFYTIRDFCKTPEDLAESLKKVADIGYKTVQLSGVCAYDPAWMKEQLDKNGLVCAITHTAADRITGDTDQLIKDHSIIGCDYIGLGAARFEEENALEVFKNTWTAPAEKMKAAGKYFMYHNHAHEFKKIDGKLILDHLAEIMPTDLMGFTVDTYWIQVGGGDPAWWLEKFAGRIPCIHLKDCAWGQKMAPVGEGNINFERVFEKAAAGGTKYMLVEQDDCNGENPFDCLKRSYDYLKSCGLE